MFWALAACNVMLGVDGVAAVGWRQPPPISIGALPAGAVLRRPTAGPQPAPVALEVPSIKVSTRLESLAVNAAGVLAVPKDFSVAGWWSSGPAPGADGAAVIVGHVDSLHGAAVFYQLRDLRPGAPSVVRRADDSTVTFVVDVLREFSKNELPTNLIYGPTASPSLRLITCSGSFDRTSRAYRDNLVVFAHLVSRSTKANTP